MVTNRINTGLSGVFTVTSNGYIMVTVTFGPGWLEMWEKAGMGIRDNGTTGQNLEL